MMLYIFKDKWASISFSLTKKSLTKKSPQKEEISSLEKFFPIDPHVKIGINVEHPHECEIHADSVKQLNDWIWAMRYRDTKNLLYFLKHREDDNKYWISLKKPHKEDKITDILFSYGVSKKSVKPTTDSYFSSLERVISSFSPQMVKIFPHVPHACEIIAETKEKLDEFIELLKERHPRLLFVTKNEKEIQRCWLLHFPPETETRTLREILCSYGVPRERFFPSDLPSVRIFIHNQNEAEVIAECEAELDIWILSIAAQTNHSVYYEKNEKEKNKLIIKTSLLNFRRTGLELRELLISCKVPLSSFY